MGIIVNGLNEQWGYKMNSGWMCLSLEWIPNEWKRKESQKKIATKKRGVDVSICLL